MIHNREALFECLKNLITECLVVADLLQQKETDATLIVENNSLSAFAKNIDKRWVINLFSESIAFKYSDALKRFINFDTLKIDIFLNEYKCPRVFIEALKANSDFMQFNEALYKHSADETDTEVTLDIYGINSRCIEVGNVFKDVMKDINTSNDNQKDLK